MKILRLEATYKPGGDLDIESTHEEDFLILPPALKTELHPFYFCYWVNDSWTRKCVSPDDPIKSTRALWSWQEKQQPIQKKRKRDFLIILIVALFNVHSGEKTAVNRINSIGFQFNSTSGRDIHAIAQGSSIAYKEKKKKGSKKYKKTRSRPSDERKDKRQVMREKKKTWFVGIAETDFFLPSKNKIHHSLLPV